MARPATAQEEQAQEHLARQGVRPVVVGAGDDDYVQVSAQVVAPTKPIVSAKIIYLGANPAKSITLVGGIHTQTIGTRTVKSIVDDGVTSVYDFSSLDAVGRPIESRLMPAAAPDDVRRRPFLIVEHPEHIRHFLRLRDGSNQPEFRVWVAREHREALQEYIQRVERRHQRREALYKEVREHATGSAA